MAMLPWLPLHNWLIKLFYFLRFLRVYMYVVYIWKWSSAHALGASVVWHRSLLLMNGFNKTEAAVVSCRLCFLRAFPFISFFKHWFIFKCVILMSLYFVKRKNYERSLISLYIEHSRILGITFEFGKNEKKCVHMHLFVSVS